MKKNCIIAVLTFAVIGSVLCGCGKKNADTLSTEVIAAEGKGDVQGISTEVHEDAQIDTGQSDKGITFDVTYIKDLETTDTYSLDVSDLSVMNGDGEVVFSVETDDFEGNCIMSVYRDFDSDKDPEKIVDLVDDTGNGTYDGVYTGSYEVKSDIEEEQFYFAVISYNGKLFRTGNVGITVYQPFTEEELKNDAEVQQAVDEIMNSELYENMQTADRIIALEKCLEEYIEKGYVKQYDVSDDEDYPHIWYETTSGVHNGIAVNGELWEKEVSSNESAIN